ncbi:MAG: hypothetical protein LBD17_04190 [Endomicrobium sp.]|nr:hypothetical protein [Endomicrobium sp.]
MQKIKNSVIFCISFTIGAAGFGLGHLYATISLDSKYQKELDKYQEFQQKTIVRQLSAFESERRIVISNIETSRNIESSIANISKEIQELEAVNNDIKIIVNRLRNNYNLLTN